MLGRAGVNTPFSLWKFLESQQTYASIYEVTHNGSWNISPTVGRAVWSIKQVGHPQLAEVAMGEGGSLPVTSGNHGPTTSTPLN